MQGQRHSRPSPQDLRVQRKKIDLINSREAVKRSPFMRQKIAASPCNYSVRTERERERALFRLSQGVYYYITEDHCYLFYFYFGIFHAILLRSNSVMINPHMQTDPCRHFQTGVHPW